MNCEQQKKKKKIRKQKKIVIDTDTNRYKHWEIRTAFVGVIIQYIPQAKKDIQEMGVENWYNACVQNASSIIPFTDPQFKNDIKQ